MRAQRDFADPFPNGKTDRSLSQLFSDLVGDASLLIRQEIALAKAELTQALQSLGTGIGLVAAGGLVAFAGFLFLLAAASLGLATVLEPWLAALIVGGVVAVIGIILVLVGKGRLAANKLAPHRTIRSIEDDAQWMSERMR